MIIIANFIDSDSNPIIGITPTIEIFQISSDTIVSSGSMSYSNFKGYHEYEFVLYDTTKIYEYWIDGGDSLEDFYRYQWGIINPEEPKIPVIEFD